VIRIRGLDQLDRRTRPTGRDMMVLMADKVGAEARSLVVDLERELQTRACRANPDRLRELLAPDFVEIGASGRRWDREEILELLGREDGSVGDIEMSAVQSRSLALGVVQVLWQSMVSGRHVRRTSIWCERAAGWQLVFHQGTPVP
jgi:hypothetical protein